MFALHVARFGDAIPFFVERAQARVRLLIFAVELVEAFRVSRDFRLRELLGERGELLLGGADFRFDNLCVARLLLLDDFNF